MEAVAAEAVFATAAEAVVADTMIMAAAEVTASGLAVGGGLAAEAIAAGELVGPGAASVLGDAAVGTLAGAEIASGDFGLWGADVANAGGAALGGEAGTVGAAGTELTGADVVGAGPKAIPTETPLKKGSVLDWLKNNKTTATVGGQLVAGALQGAGAAMGAKNAAKIKAESDRALLQQQTDEKMRLSREGTYTGKAGPVPSGNPILRRLSNGQLVYVNGSGIIGNRIA